MPLPVSGFPATTPLKAALSAPHQPDEAARVSPSGQTREQQGLLSLTTPSRRSLCSATTPTTATYETSDEVQLTPSSFPVGLEKEERNGERGDQLQLQQHHDSYKIVYLIRHGESLGQVAPDRHTRQTDPSLLDCGLSPRGCDQALALRRTLVRQSTVVPVVSPECNASSTNSTLMEQIQLVLCSPLTRALQTACLVFGQPTNDDRDKPIVDSGCDGTDTDDQNTEWATKPTARTTAHFARRRDMFPPIVCHYHLREIGSGIPENIPRPMPVVKAHLLHHVRPPIPLSVIDHQLDVSTLQPSNVAWPKHHDVAPSVIRRNHIQETLYWLAQSRPETHIAIVCHYHVIRIALLPPPQVSMSTPRKLISSQHHRTPSKPMPSSSTPQKRTPPSKPMSMSSTPQQRTTPPVSGSQLCHRPDGTPLPLVSLSSPLSSAAVMLSARDIKPGNACFWTCRLCCVTGRLTLITKNEPDAPIIATPQTATPPSSGYRL